MKRHNSSDSGKIKDDVMNMSKLCQYNRCSNPDSIKFSTVNNCLSTRTYFPTPLNILFNMNTCFYLLIR